MARTSRVHKEGRPQGKKPEKMSTGKVYRVALYVRLSVLDSGHKDSDTAETQELLLRRFIEGKILQKQEVIGALEVRMEHERKELEDLVNEQKKKEVDVLYDFIKASELCVNEAIEILKQHVAQQYEVTA